MLFRSGRKDKLDARHCADSLAAASQQEGPETGTSKQTLHLYSPGVSRRMRQACQCVVSGSGYGLGAPGDASAHDQESGSISGGYPGAATAPEGKGEINMSTIIHFGEVLFRWVLQTSWQAAVLVCIRGDSASHFVSLSP